MLVFRCLFRVDFHLKSESNPSFVLGRPYPPALRCGVCWDPKTKAAYVALLLRGLVAIIFTYASRWAAAGMFRHLTLL